MFHPDLHEHDPEKRKTYEHLTQAINEARDRGDIELLERIAKDPQAFILQPGWWWRGLAAGRMTMWGESWKPWEAGWAGLGLIFRVSLACAPGGSAPPLEELRSLYEHLQARILEMIETLDELRASAEMEIFREVEQDEKVIDRIAAAQREELEQEIAALEKEARAREEEIEELVGASPF
jgi:DNA polymerase-3 subunit epsilon